MNILIMFKCITGSIILFYGIFILDGKLVIRPENIDTLDAAMIEAEATLVKKIVRKGDCEGSQVGEG